MFLGLGLLELLDWELDWEFFNSFKLLSEGVLDNSENSEFISADFLRSVLLF